MRGATAIALLLAACGAPPDLSGTWRGAFFRDGVALTCAGEVDMVGELRFVRAAELPGEQYHGDWSLCTGSGNDFWARLTDDDFVFAFGGGAIAVYGRIRADNDLEGNAAGLGEGVLFRARRVVSK